MEKIINIISKIIIGFILLYLIAFVPSLFGKKPLVVVSGSMENTYNVGSLVYYENAKIEDFKIDDILVYKRNNHIISHRIVDIEKHGFVTKGDNNKTNDSKIVKNNQIIGKAYNWCIPLYGYYVDFIYKHKFLLFLSVVYLFFGLILGCYKERKIKNEKNK